MNNKNKELLVAIMNANTAMSLLEETSCLYPNMDDYDENMNNDVRLMLTGAAMLRTNQLIIKQNK